MRPELFGQLIRFGTVGIIATVIHTGVLVTLVEAFYLSPTPSNMVAFGCALTASYIGNYFWTYRSSASHTDTVIKFLAIALSAAALNYSIFHLMVDRLQLHYMFALGVVLVTVPSITFIFQKTWAFR